MNVLNTVISVRVKISLFLFSKVRLFIARLVGITCVNNGTIPKHFGCNKLQYDNLPRTRYGKNPFEKTITG